MHGHIGKRIIIYQTILVLETLHLSFIVCFAEAGKVASTYEFVFSYCPCTQVIFFTCRFYENYNNAKQDKAIFMS
jgi:hypothetical protein